MSLCSRFSCVLSTPVPGCWLGNSSRPSRKTAPPRCRAPQEAPTIPGTGADRDADGCDRRRSRWFQPTVAEDGSSQVPRTTGGAHNTRHRRGPGRRRMRPPRGAGGWVEEAKEARSSGDSGGSAAVSLLVFVGDREGRGAGSGGTGGEYEETREAAYRLGIRGDATIRTVRF
jgi:hypothetical protein